MVSKFKLVTSDEKKGVWLSELELIKLIQITYIRNRKLSKKLINDYEYLKDESFDYSLVGEFVKQ